MNDILRILKFFLVVESVKIRYYDSMSLMHTEDRRGLASLPAQRRLRIHYD